MKNDELRNPQVKHRHSAQRLVSAGMSLREVAEVLGVSRWTLRRMLKDLTNRVVQNGKNGNEP